MNVNCDKKCLKIFNFAFFQKLAKIENLSKDCITSTVSVFQLSSSDPAIKQYIKHLDETENLGKRYSAYL